MMTPLLACASRWVDALGAASQPSSIAQGGPPRSSRQALLSQVLSTHPTVASMCSSNYLSGPKRSSAWRTASMSVSISKGLATTGTLSWVSRVAVLRGSVLSGVAVSRM